MVKRRERVLSQPKNGSSIKMTWNKNIFSSGYELIQEFSLQWESRMHVLSSSHQHA